MCYEAGPHGYALYWQLTRLGVHCDVVAPTLVPVRSGDRVKTNRRDAEKLARCYRSGDLTPVWVPDAAHEALRDVVRAREAAKKDQLRARHRLSKFLLRRGLRAAAGVKTWTTKHLAWVRTLRFDQLAQEAAFLDYLHEVEHAAERVERLEHAIDRAIEASPVGLSEPVKEIAWKAQHRLSSRYRRLLLKGKPRQKTVIAMARELLGFVWAIGIQVDKEQRQPGRRRVA